VKLASFHAGGQDRVGILADDTTLIEIPGAHSLLELIEAGSFAFASVAKYSVNDVVWHPPVRRPSKICCLALNNSANSEIILVRIFIRPFVPELPARGRAPV